MKKKSKLSRIIPFVLALVLLVSALTVIMTSAADSDEIEVVGAMSTIKEAFDEKYLAQATVRADDDYVGKIQYTAYYDTSKGAIKTGYEGTPVIVYTVNHPGVTRVGTDSDTDIIQSMLNRGYVVIVLDYLNNAAAVSPAIDNSSQQFRIDLRNGKIINQSSVFPSATNYHENFVAPSGYNVLLNQVFWEIDKHSAEGTLEKIVENWNSDFRATKGGNFVKWVHDDGTRKAVQNDLDGNAPVWYNENKQVDAENGQYTYIRFTKAETVTDCIDPDGSFLDMNLYINIVYPTNPVNPVPVMSLANSSGYPTTSVTGADIRPHSNGFLYNGYANVVFDYLWQPMARNASWGYYDGSAGNTGDHMNYGLMMYNDKLVNTAAMRYLRYVSLSGGTEYNFDLDAFGVYGNSKGGWFSFLGEEILQSNLVDPTGKTTAELEIALDKVLSEFVPDRYYNGQHGETRYQVGAGEINADGFTVKAGEKQPWLTYNGIEILSGAQLTNACNGSQEEDITAGHSPIFISGNMADTYNAAYSYSVNIYNMCRELNIPLLHFEVPIGHTLTSGIDMNYNVDTYDAYFRYVNYYLKNTAISVAYISPMDNAGNVKVTDKITVYFAGAAEISEVEKITVTSADGIVTGAWESSFGGTTWTFIPDSLEGSTLYTVTVPATFKGDNGVAIGKEFTSSFITELDVATAANISGSYHTVTVPSLTSGNSYVFRFTVNNDAVNTAELYAVSAVGETSGEYLGSVRVNGAGAYEIDITDFAAKNIGNEIIFYLKTATAGNYDLFTDENGNYKDPFDTHSKANTSTVTYASGALIPGTTDEAFKVAITAPTNKNNISYYYDNVTSVFTYSGIAGSSTVTENAAKRFIISFDVYDTVSRRLQIRLKTMTSRTDYGTIDYDNIIFTVETKANESTHVEFTYNPYETKYGFASEKSDRRVMFMEILLSPDGDNASPAYFNNLRTVEVLTDLSVTSAEIAEKNDGTGMAYTPAVSESPFALYNGATKVGDYAGWKAALAAYKSGYTVKLQSDYTFTDSDISDAIGSFSEVNVDLSGYTITSENTTKSLLYLKATNTTGTTVNVTGGAILLSRTALVSYESSSASGSGKTFSVNLDDVYVGFVDNAFTTEVISSSASPAGISLNVNFNLNGCTVDLPDANHARDAFAVFTNPASDTLNVKYNVTGGEFKLTSQRWATVSENANIVEFFEDSNGNYTTLVMPASNTYDVSGSYLNADGYAIYTKSSTTDNMTTYVLENGENSTRYGVITDTYMDETQYPFLVFKDGNLLGGYDTYTAAVNAAHTALKGAAFVNSEAQVYIRANASITSETSINASAGTIVVDLNGFTLFRQKNPANMVVNSSTVFDYASGILYKNGRIEMNHSYNSEKDTYSAGLLGATHVLKETEEVKTFNVTYENITFGFIEGYYASLNANGLLWSVWQNSYTSETITNLTLTDCVFDFTTNAPTGKNLIYAKGTYADFNIEINGGEIKGDGSAFSLVVTDSEDTFILGKNSQGDYISVADGGVPTSDSFLCDDGVYRCFQEDSGAYVLVENPLSTKYGMIPDTNGNDTFVLFSDGEFVSGHTTWASATKAAGNLLNGNTSKKAQLLVRKDYTNTDDACSYSALGNCNGELTIDLGGKTFTRAKVIFDFSYQTSNVNPANVVIKNGTLLSNGSAIFANQIGAGGTTDAKVWNVTVEDVIIGFSASASKHSDAIWASWTNPTMVDGVADKTTVIHGSQTNVSFINCTLDLQTVVPYSGSTLFDFSDNNSYDLMMTDVTFKGGKILTNNLSNVNLFSVNSAESDKITFVKDDSGKYMTMTTPTTAAYSDVHCKSTFNTPEGTMYFIEMADDGSVSTYELGKMSFDGYGTISTSNSKYLSAVDYPFVTFMNGSFKAGYGKWKEALNGAKSLVSAEGSEEQTVIILQRRDYSLTKAADSGSSFNNARGKIVFDLGGFTLTNTDNYFIDIYLNYSSNTDCLGYKSSIEIKNGTMLNARVGSPMIAIGHINTNDSYDIKEYAFTFTNITFLMPSGTKMIQEWGPDSTNNKHNGDGLKVEYVFNGCTFDFTGAASSAKVLIATNTYNQPSVIVKGGSIIADSIASYSLYSLKSGAVNYLEKDENGNYVTLTQLTDSAAPTLTFKNEAGTVLSFGKDSASGLYTTYKIGEPIYTPYGYIPFMYQSTEDYPFVAFDGDGNLIKAAPYLYGANDEANSVMGRVKEYLKANVWDGTSYGDSPLTAYILLRRDYAMASDETFNNLAQVQGLVTIDLDGYTLTVNDGKPLFPSTIKPWGSSGDSNIFETRFEVINGQIEIGKKPLINLGAWAANGTDVSGKMFIYSFTNVEFIASSNTTSMFTSYYQDADTPEAIGNPELIFNNCTFNLNNAKSGIVLFDLGNGYIHTSVTVNGGEIIAKSNDFVMFTKNEATVSNLTFTKSEGGNYTALTLPLGTEAPADEYGIENGTAEFVKVSETADTVTYRLRNTLASGFNYSPKMSITLANSFIMNVYVPVNCTEEFTFNGVTYNTDNSFGGTVITIDGKDYYLVAVALGSSEAAKEMKLVSKVQIGENTASATFTFSIPKYVVKVLNNTAATEIEKTLARDVLAYIKEAYNYFDTHNNEEEIARVNALIESIIGDYTAAPVSAGTTVNAAGVTGVTLNLDAKPTIRFYVTDMSLEFYVGEKKLNTVKNEAEGYIELDVYAYALCETITYGEGGSYHISSFVNGAASTEYESLVKAFVKYVESAAAYRNSVVNN